MYIFVYVLTLLSYSFCMNKRCQYLVVYFFFRDKGKKLKLNLKNNWRIT